MKNIKNTIVVALTLVAIVSCGDSNSPEAKKAKLEKLKAQYAQLATNIKSLEEELANAGVNLDANKKVVNVAVSELKPTIYKHYIDVQGAVDGDENTTISAKVIGTVTKVYVEPGSFVKAGQVLAEIDADALKRQVDALEVNVKLATEIFEKQKALWEQQIGSEIQFKQAKANMESLQEQLKSLKEQVKMYKITSAVNGTIDMVNVKIGQLVSPGLPLFSIVNSNKLKIKANVSEAHAAKIKEGQDVLIYFPDIKKQTTGKIKYSGKGINLINRTISIDVDFKVVDDIIPNMVAELKIVDYQNNNAFVIPVNAIQYGTESKFVYVAVIENGKKIARKREVVVGSTYNDIAEITGGLQAGDKIITVGYSDLNDGDAINF